MNNENDAGLPSQSLPLEGKVSPKVTDEVDAASPATPVVAADPSGQNTPAPADPNDPAAKAKKLLALMEKGRAFGMVYKFDAMNVLMKTSGDLKKAGSNGKSKGLRMSADLIANLPPVKNAVVVTRCENCAAYHQERTWCDKHKCPFPPDGYCSQPDKKPPAKPSP